MASTLRFHPQVAHDLTDAIDWYDERCDGLGNSFRAAVDDRLDAIGANPLLFGLADEDLRFARLHRFPYLVLFRLHAE